MRLILAVFYMHLQLMRGPPTFEMRARKKNVFRLARLIPPCSDGSPAMPESIQTTGIAATAGPASDADLLAQTAIAVRAAGSALRERFGDVVRYQTRGELMHALAANDDAALDVLHPRLTHLRPDARFAEDELAGGG